MQQWKQSCKLRCCFMTVIASIVQLLILFNGCMHPCLYIWTHMSSFSQTNSNWTPQFTIWHDRKANCCVSKVLCMPVTLCDWAGIAHLAKCQKIITCSHCSDQSTSTLSQCQCVMQLTGTPDGGCHVEHKLKVQPVLDAPALFSKSALSSCSCSRCV